jgi:hypothetical protein
MQCRLADALAACCDQARCSCIKPASRCQGCVAGKASYLQPRGVETVITICQLRALQLLRRCLVDCNHQLARSPCEDIMLRAWQCVTALLLLSSACEYPCTNAAAGRQLLSSKLLSRTPPLAPWMPYGQQFTELVVHPACHTASHSSTQHVACHRDHNHAQPK